MRYRIPFYGSVLSGMGRAGLGFGIGVLLAAAVHARSLPHRGGRSRYEVLTG